MQLVYIQLNGLGYKAIFYGIVSNFIRVTFNKLVSC